MTKKKLQKEPKRKPKFGFFSCVGYMYAYMWKNERALALSAILSIPVSLLLSAVGLYTPSAIIRSLESSDRFSAVALVIVGLALASLLFTLCDSVIRVQIKSVEHILVLRMIYDRTAYLRSRDPYLDYSKAVQEADARADAAILNNYTAGVHFPMDAAEMLSRILRFFLFGAITVTLSGWILLLLALGCTVTFFMRKREREENYRTRDERNRTDKKLRYLSYNISNTMFYGKDIRLYHLRDYLSLLGKRLLGESITQKGEMEARGLRTAIVSFLVVLVRDAAAYAFLILKVHAGEVDAASFVLYFSAITALSDFLSGILDSVGRLQDGALQTSDYREGFEIRGALNDGEGIPLPRGAFSIEFRNVSYKYPEGERTVLDHISFRIRAGEKIALVGLNGAGKTTLTKLMCGLILPDEGEVLLDGHSVTEYNREELYSLFGLVPQEFAILPVSIARNIAVSGEDEEIDSERLARCIEAAGLSEKIAALPQGVNTPLVRRIHPDGVELSGGETQKLLLARAMYRHPQCLILDEPTAALDPIAEDRLYHRYNEISADATSVFISHRLASTRFCDRIFFLDGARFTEEGTHEELMQADGQYKKLFELQSRYYREGGTENA